ncbi:MAG: anaerobic ribonucleoside-triphosphate reductase activating protein [Clostridia bacterium]|nr:anaerobic ribonucleoside-triphosphate reductase activating protein [Clostridia bacterium]
MGEDFVINGFQKMTLLDYPEKVACTVFLAGCNFRCPFCHNASLVLGSGYERHTADEILSYLKGRKGLIDGVCITGGEPLLRSGIEEFIGNIKELGFSVKLDTNGSRPDKLMHLVNCNLIDYVAMDIKNSLEKYSTTSGVDNLDISTIEESIDFLIGSTIDFEFRTTVVKELHTEEDILKIAERIKGAKKYYLQSFVDSGDLLSQNLHAHTKETLEKMRDLALPYIETVGIRGI